MLLFGHIVLAEAVSKWESDVSAEDLLREVTEK